MAIKIEKMTYEKVAEMLGKGFHCSQATLWHYAEAFGMDPELALKVSTGLPSGGFNGGTCGAIAGPVMAISLLFGFNNSSTPEEVTAGNKKIMALSWAFQKKFAEKYPSSICKDILGGYSFGVPEEFAYIMQNKLTAPCIQLCVDACEIMDNLLIEQGIIEY